MKKFLPALSALIVLCGCQQHADPRIKSVVYMDDQRVPYNSSSYTYDAEGRLATMDGVPCVYTKEKIVYNDRSIARYVYVNTSGLADSFDMYNYPNQIFLSSGALEYNAAGQVTEERLYSPGDEYIRQRTYDAQGNAVLVSQYYIGKDSTAPPYTCVYDTTHINTISHEYTGMSAFGKESRNVITAMYNAVGDTTFYSYHFNTAGRIDTVYERTKRPETDIMCITSYSYY